MSPSSPVWRPLPLPADTNLPALLVSFILQRDSYAVYVTDMANIWSETMDRRSILRRSLDEDTTIDPTDSAQNLQAFLSRIHSAFDPSHEHHADSRMSLATGSPFETTGCDDGLVLRITCHLPDMEPLRWPIYLQKRASSTLATELVVPLFRHSLLQNRQLASLLHIIRQKDALITQLSVKMESTGTRLDQVFTQLSAKHKVSRAVAEKEVQGLKPFQQVEWEASFQDEASEDSKLSELSEALLGSQGLKYRSYTDDQNSPLDDWWTNRDDDIPITKSLGRSVAVEKTSSEGPEGTTKDKGDDDSDDFQIQATPPHLSHRRKQPRRQIDPAADDATTEDEDEEPKERQSPQKPLQGSAGHSTQKSPSTRLGAIGSGNKKRAETDLSSPSIPPRATEQAEQAAAGSDTESEADEDATASSSPSPPGPASTPPTQKSPKKILGKIGGRKPPGASPTQSKSPDKASHQTSASPKKLGQIGRKSPSNSEDPQKEGPRGREGASRDQPKSELRKRETSEERANRKREELQQELERKAAAGPTRKKRKF